MVLTGVIIHGSTSIIKPKVSYHKKSLDLVTGNFLLQVVTLLSDLSSDIEPSGLFQPKLKGQEAFFVQIRSTPLKLFQDTSIVFPICYYEVNNFLF
jgi:hypothetical protein